MLMRIATFVACIAAVGIAGCSHYFEPISGGTAKLRFVSLPGSRTEIHELASRECLGDTTAAIATVGLNVKDGAGQGRSKGMPLQETVPRPAASETLIPAGKPFAAQLRASRTPGPRAANWSYEACTRGFVLVAQEGEYYEAQLEQYHGGCVLNVFHITRERDGSYVRRVAENARHIKTRCN